MKHSSDSLPDYSALIELLVLRNQTCGLTAIRSPDAIQVKHIEDSQVLSSYIFTHHPSSQRLLDMGTGAGFPGLIVAAELADKNVLLLDSTMKKIQFVSEAIRLLKLDNAFPVCERLESFALAHSNQFDLVFARSVARLDILMELAHPLLRKGGVLLAMKSQDLEDELGIAGSVESSLGFIIKNPFEYTLSGATRYIIEVQKTSPSSIFLPRRTGLAQKNPLSRRLLA
ncbi:MAG: 16S rRNA (guanine(527)-N(7))-methyltransferase RsmG [Candidatus Margulisiibacteriota bacterium]